MLKIQDVRKKVGMTQIELSKNARIDRAAISLYETGKRTPSLKTLEKIAKALGVQTVELIGEI